MKRILSVLLALSMLLAMGTTVFAEIGHRDEARAVLNYVNEERRNAGLPSLKWESSLEDYATTRAKEAMQRWSHTRPNGKSSLDYAGVNGENLAMGDTNAYDVVQGWMNSPDHRDNILYEYFTSMAVACVESDNGTYYWCQIFHSDYKMKSDGTIIDPDGNPVSGTGSGTSSGTSKSSSTASTAAASTTGTAVTSTSVVSALNDANGAGVANVIATVTNKDTVSPAVLKEMISWGSGKSKATTLVANTTFSESKKIQGQIRLNPANFSKLNQDLKLGVYVEEAKVSKVLSNFNKWYSNNVAVVKLEQTGSLTGAVQIAAKADLSKLDTGKLVFYSYDKASNVVARIKNPGYSVDKNGFVHFTTSIGDYIIIADAALAKK